MVKVTLGDGRGGEVAAVELHPGGAIARALQEGALTLGGRVLVRAGTELCGGLLLPGPDGLVFLGGGGGVPTFADMAAKLHYELTGELPATAAVVVAGRE